MTKEKEKKLLSTPEAQLTGKELSLRIYRLIRPYWKAMLVVIASVVAMEILGIEVPLIIRSALAQMRAGDSDGLWRVATLALVVFIFISICRFSLIYAGHVVGYSIVADFRRMLYGHLQKLSRKFYADTPTGDLLSRCTTDINHMESLVAHAIPSIIRCVLVLTCVPAIMIWLRWDLALISILPIPILAVLVFVFTKKVHVLYRRLSERIGKVMSLVSDNVTGMDVIQAFTREQSELNRFDQHNNSFLSDAVRIMRNLGVWFGTTTFLSSAGTVLALLYGGYLTVEGKMPIEDIVAFLFYVGFFYGPVMELNGVLDFYAQARAGAERVFKILNINPDIADRPGALEIDKISGKINFENVSFKYLEGIPVLKGINFEVNPNQMVALVGPTGAGKSTLISLLPRFYDVSEGVIRIDGHDLRDLSLRTLRKNISLVLQDVFLFNGTIKENIAFGNPEANDQDIINAATAANAHGFITDTEEGYDTHVGEHGVKLSGGQKQRLAIARALLKNAPILILDEATSAVDTETESLIQEALDRLMKNRTTLVIAHRLSTILHADKILVINDNRIAESGTHEELIRKGGLYRKLYEIQFRHAAGEHERFKQLVDGR